MDYPYSNFTQQSAPIEANTFEPTPEEVEEQERKQLSYKRLTIFLIVVALILVAFIIWEVVELSMQWRP